MVEYGKKKIEWLEFDLLEPYPQVVHGVFLRHGGTSHPPFASLNLGNAVGDHPDCVKVNREKARQMLGLPKVFYAHQTHGATVYRVTGKELEALPPADALFTTEKNIGLAVTHADCQAILFYDPKHECIALAHAGWKGSALNIAARVVEALVQEIGTKPQDLIACVSPSLCPEHSEQKNFQKELPKELWDFQVKPLYFDFWEITKKQLSSAGVSEAKMENSRFCTYCNEGDYYSYRRDGKETGRHATIAALKG